MGAHRQHENEAMQFVVVHVCGNTYLGYMLLTGQHMVYDINELYRDRARREAETYMCMTECVEDQSSCAIEIKSMQTQPIIKLAESA